MPEGKNKGNKIKRNTTKKSLGRERGATEKKTERNAEGRKKKEKGKQQNEKKRKRNAKTKNKEHMKMRREKKENKETEDSEKKKNTKKCLILYPFLLCEIDCGSPQGRYPDKGPKKKKEKGKQKEVGDQ